MNINKKGTKRQRDRKDEDEDGKRARRVDNIANLSELNMSQERNFVLSRDLAPNKAGCLQRVNIKNFMCHGNLSFEFDERINFIVGKNGSGKSAIMTALIVGLGGKAAVTGRANAIKVLIKSGKQTAEVALTLCNTGRSAYKHDEYGDSITVVRKFSHDGGSQYQLKSNQGRVVSTKYHELLNIIDQFNIQIDNPVVVLNQDASKYFLNSKNTKDKYKFFMKATTLDQVQNDYSSAGIYRDKAVALIEKKEKVVQTLKQAVMKLEQRYKNLQSLNNLHQKIVDLANEQAWSFVTMKEKEADHLRRNLHSHKIRVPKFDKALAEHEAKRNDATLRTEELRAEHKALVEQQKSLVPGYQMAIAEVKEKKDIERSNLAEVKKIEARHKSTKKDHDHIREKIDQIRNTQQHDYEADKRGREERIVTLEATLSEKTSQHKTRSNDIEQFRSEVSRLRAEMGKIESDTKSFTHQLRRLGDDKRQVETSRSNRMRRFGANMPAVVHNIDDAFKRGAFHKRPRGPIGACIRLKDYSWALAIESCIRGLLYSFCVHDHHDAQVLAQIFSRCKLAKSPSIITSKFQDRPYDVSRFKPALSQFPTVLEMIDTDDPVILNTLIDQRTVENILLIKDEDEAVNIMRSSQPRNVNEVYTALGSQLFCYPTFRFYAGQRDRVEYLSESIEETIAGIDTQIARLEESVAQSGVVRERLAGEVRSNETLRRKCEGQVKGLSDHINKISVEITELNNTEDPIPVDIKTLEEDVDNLKNKMKVLEENRQEMLRQHQQAKSQYETCEDEKRKLRDEVKALEDQEEPMKNKLHTARGTVAQMENHVKHYQLKKKELDDEIAKCCGELTQFMQVLEVDIENAREMCPERIETRRTPRNILAEIEQIQTRIQVEQDKHGDINEIKAELQTKQEEYRVTRTLVINMRNFLQKLSMALENRELTFKNFRQYVAIRVQYQFMHMLQQRNFNGKMILNHDSQTLDMHIQPKEGTPGMTQDLRSLSGGERSFTTVSFILALWHVMPAPFRALDEFDVYMDMVNRKVSLDMLVEKAQESGKQFLFLTPQNMSNLTNMKNITVLRMQDPER